MKEIKYRKKNNQKGGFYDIPKENIEQISTDSIRPNHSQPRANFDNNSMIRLADSIRRYGILQPLTVRKAEDGDIYDYELVAGERRLRAAKMLGFFTVPCIILEVDEKTSAELAIIENLLREDLNIFEQANSFRRLIDDYGLTQDELARKMSMSQSAIANKLRLLKLTYPEQRKILELSLSERHARALLKICDVEERLEIITRIGEGNLTVQETEDMIEKILLVKAASESCASGENQQDNPKNQSEKDAAEWIKSFKRKIDSLSKSGKKATMDIKNGSKSIVLTIRIEK